MQVVPVYDLERSLLTRELPGFPPTTAVPHFLDLNETT